MASYSYSDDEDQKLQAAQAKLSAPTAPAPTFAQLQQRGMPRPPPATATNALYGAAGQPPPGAMASARAPIDGGTGGPSVGPAPLGPDGQPLYNLPHGGTTVGHPIVPNGPAQPPGPYVGQRPPTDAGGSGPLNQSTLEAYLYQLLSDPTSTSTYKNSMQRIGSATDVDASKRGLFNSTVPVGINASAGSNLASGLQAQAYDQLRGYNQDYESLLKTLLGVT